MNNTQKVDLKTIEESYKKHNNIWKVAEEVGLCGQSVWERLKKHNLINKKRKINRKDIFKDYDILKEKYNNYVDNGKLDELAKELNRTKNFICRKAKELGLTNKNRKLSEKHILNSKIARKNMWKIHEHPKGMLGKKHSKDVCEKMKKINKDKWNNYSDEKKIEIIKKQINTRLLKYGTLNKNNKRGNWKQGWETIGNKNYFFRSSWEHIYAKHLFEKHINLEILNWEYEPSIFSFPEEKNCNLYYKPDFKVTNIDGSIEYHEVKGWMCERSKIKISLMNKWHKNIKLILITKDWFIKNNLIKRKKNNV